MTIVEKQQAVSNANSLKELADVIRSLAVDGEIEGSSSSFNAEKMAATCENVDVYTLRSLTRNFGIRQRARTLYKN
jgi:hypothetical protein